MKLIFITIIAFICALTVLSVQSRKVSLRTRVQDADHVDDIGEGLVLLVGGLQNGRKSINQKALARAKILYHVIAKKILRQNEEALTEQPEADTKNDDATIVEHELKNALTKKSSALHEKPFLQHKGRNDFLVFSAGVQDPFVTVVPNDIYYNVEKRCVNWLDDCNERGIRAKLLQRVQSPYR